VLATAVVFDVLGLITGRSGYAIAAGVVAAVFGLIDWTAIPAGTRAKRVGVLHGLGNLLVAGSWLLRAAAGGREPGVWALVLGFAGFALAGVSGWLGGELVDRPPTASRSAGGRRRSGLHHG
jgi:uncharacterized membrane protein